MGKYIKFNSLDAVYEYYDNQIVKILNMEQVKYYIKHDVRPDYMEVSPYDSSIVFYFGKRNTTDVWEHWKNISQKRK